MLAPGLIPTSGPPSFIPRLANRGSPSPPWRSCLAVPISPSLRLLIAPSRQHGLSNRMVLFHLVVAGNHRHDPVVKGSGAPVLEAYGEPGPGQSGQSGVEE